MIHVKTRDNISLSLVQYILVGFAFKKKQRINIGTNYCIKSNLLDIDRLWYIFSMSSVSVRCD